MSGKNGGAVIIKRKKVVAGGGHHGGAWKVAYADFVTAMMAFFLLMWLLNATTEKQRKGIADYFNPTIPVNRVSGGGKDALNGDTVFPADSLARSGTGASTFLPAGEETGGLARRDDKTATREEDAQFEGLQRMLQGSGGESMVTENLARHIVTRVTDEGLIVELFDLEDAPLFSRDGAEPQPVTHELAGVVARVFALVGNPVAVTGHTSARPEVLRVNPVWGLSLSRGQSMRQLLEAAGLDARRFRRLTGYADRMPAVPNPMAARNNRIELVLLRSDRP